MPAERSKRNGKGGCSDPCLICGRTVSRALDMKRHMLTHDDSAKLPCPFEDCSFRTLQKSNLNTHIRRHKNEKIFVCKDEDCCPFATADPSSLLRHRKRLHEYIPRFQIIFRGDSSEEDDIAEIRPSRALQDVSKRKQAKQKKQTGKRKEKKQKTSNAKLVSHPLESNSIDVSFEPPAPSPSSSSVLTMTHIASEPQFIADQSPQMDHPLVIKSKGRVSYKLRAHDSPQEVPDTYYHDTSSIYMPISYVRSSRSSIGKI